MRIAAVGNYRPESSSENEWRKALTALGHEVTLWQENERSTWLSVGDADADLIVWTRTGWDWSAVGWSWEEATDHQREALERWRERGVPSLGLHLDRWIGLDREGQIHDEPFFRVDTLATADGGHQAEFEQAGINHVWFPPGISAEETVPGAPHPDFISEIAFVGSWKGGYHAEWTHRPALIDFLRSTYGSRVRFFPESGGAIRGPALRDLYASVAVSVGDSCLVPNADGTPAKMYCSDRVSEATGRGAFLIHPRVEGVTDGTLWQEGEHLACWDLWDWDQLKEQIDYYLEHAEERRRIAEAGRAHTIEHHTYTVRLRELLAQVMA